MGGGTVIDALAKVIFLEGYRDLSREACAAFNRRAEAVEARNGVVYQTWSSVEPEEKNVFMTLTAPWRIIHREEGANDGLVAESSQAWTEALRDGDVVKRVERHRFPFPANRWSRSDGLIGLGAKIDEYETRVGEVYLEIARSVAGVV